MLASPCHGLSPAGRQLNSTSRFLLTGQSYILAVTHSHVRHWQCPPHLLIPPRINTQQRSGDSLLNDVLNPRRPALFITSPLLNPLPYSPQSEPGSGPGPLFPIWTATRTPCPSPTHLQRRTRPVAPTLGGSVDELHHCRNGSVKAQLLRLGGDLLDSGVQQPQLLSGGSIVAHTTLKQPPYTGQEAVHTLHTARGPNLSRSTSSNMKQFR